MSKEIFKTLSKIDLKGKVEKKGRHGYISWANAWMMVKQQFPNAQRTIYEHEDTGLNYFSDGNTAYVKVGITIEGLEHVDMLPIMDYRNNSIKLDKITSMDVNTAIQRSTTKCIAMHGLGLEMWIGEDTMQTINNAPVTTAPPKEKKKVVLEVEDKNWSKVLKYIAQNKELGLSQIVKNLEVKYSIKAAVKKEMSKHIS